VAGDVFRQEFQGHKATEAGVFGFVDDAHPAAAELIDNAVVGDDLADEAIRFGHCLGHVRWARKPRQRRSGIGDRCSPDRVTQFGAILKIASPALSFFFRYYDIPFGGGASLLFSSYLGVLGWMPLGVCSA